MPQLRHFRLRSRHEVAAQGLGRLPGFLDDAVGLVLGVGQLALVLVEDRLGLCLHLLGVVEVGADALGAVVHHLGDGRERKAPHADQEDDERDRPPDDLVGRGEDGVLGLLAAFLGGLHDKRKDVHNTS